MESFKSQTAILCVALLVVPLAAAAEPPASGNFARRVVARYLPQEEPQARLQNSGRIESLLRDGNLYVSLQDAIALALENNVDIEIQRYAPRIANLGLLRARGGAAARGVSTTATAGPTSAGTTAAAGSPLSITLAAGAAAQSGSALPALDPTITGSAKWAHLSTPQADTGTTGINELVQRQDSSSVVFTKGFLTGTTTALSLTTARVRTNSLLADFRPSTTSALSLVVTQHLLQGFGPGVNARQLRIARNNLAMSDAVFKLQTVTTVSAVMNLYWDLVSFNQDVAVRRQALAASQKLYDNNRAQVEIGTLAPIEIVRAEAEIASRQQDLILSENRLRQQETIFKNAISRTGVASPSLAEARVVPTDNITVAESETMPALQDLVKSALASRPELAEVELQVNNQALTASGTRNALRPTLDAVATVTNNALVGELNTQPGVSTALHPSMALVGGYSDVWSQILSRKFPDYSLGFSLTLPLGNRTARADAVNDQIVLRQQQLIQQRAQNQVRVDVQNALIGLTQSRAQYLSATKARTLQERTLDAEQKKLDVGASTIYNVILAQRDLLSAQSSEVTARSAYAKARVEMDRAIGETLSRNSISIGEATAGSVKRPADALPAK
jgi:outer membrane protein